MATEIFKDESGKWRWRIRAKNGAVTASSGESFDSRGNAIRASLSFVKDITDESGPVDEPEE